MFKHDAYQFDVADSKTPHERKRWVFCGIRRDIPGKITSSIKCGQGDLYDFSKHSLPNVVEADLTVTEWASFKDYENGLNGLLVFES